MGNFEKCLPIILRMEGGKVDNPKDPGGRTNQGVIQRVYDAYRLRKGVQKRDVYSMTDAERDEIYRTSYWDLIKGDQLPPGVDLVVFDGAVNSGVGQSTKWLQRAVNVADDGQMGPNTIHAAIIADPKTVIVSAVAKRVDFLRSLKTFKTFGRGWINRTTYIEQQALIMAGGFTTKTMPAVVSTDPQGAPKADPQDIKETPRAPGDAAAGAGVGAAGLGATLQTLQEQLTPFSMAGGWISKVVVALIILGAILTIGGIAWRWYASRKNAARKEAAS